VQAKLIKPDREVLGPGVFVEAAVTPDDSRQQDHGEIEHLGGANAVVSTVEFQPFGKGSREMQRA